MTRESQIRLAALERAFAGGEITQDELQDLESLRDEAGQGWLLDPGSTSPEPLSDVSNNPHAEMARRISRRLTGHDGGEQADLFGHGLFMTETCSKIRHEPIRKNEGERQRRQARRGEDHRER